MVKGIISVHLISVLEIMVGLAVDIGFWACSRLSYEKKAHPLYSITVAIVVVIWYKLVMYIGFTSC